MLDGAKNWRVARPRAQGGEACFYVCPGTAVHSKRKRTRVTQSAVVVGMALLPHPVLQRLLLPTALLPKLISLAFVFSRAVGTSMRPALESKHDDLGRRHRARLLLPQVASPTAPWPPLPQVASPTAPWPPPHNAKGKNANSISGVNCSTASMASMAQWYQDCAHDTFDCGTIIPSVILNQRKQEGHLLSAMSS